MTYVELNVVVVACGIFYLQRELGVVVRCLILLSECHSNFIHLMNMKVRNCEVRMKFVFKAYKR